MSETSTDPDLWRETAEDFLTNAERCTRLARASNDHRSTRKVARSCPRIRGKSRRGKNASTALIRLTCAAPQPWHRLGQSSQRSRSRTRKRSPHQVRNTLTPLSLCYSAHWERSCRSFCCFWADPEHWISLA